MRVAGRFVCADVAFGSAGFSLRAAGAAKGNVTSYTETPLPDGAVQRVYTDPVAEVTESLQSADGLTTQSWLPTGVYMETASTTDPQYGAERPLELYVKTPSGLEQTVLYDLYYDDID